MRVIISTCLILATVLWGCKASKESTATDVVTTQPTEKKDEPVKNKGKHSLVLMTTNYGEIKLKLYDETPQHRDNFKKLVTEQYYDSLLFHRVIRDFMIQGGDPNSRGASSSARLGSGGPGYMVPAEFNPTLIHKKGALAAARNNNPEKKSSGSQFYIVQGKTATDTELDNMEKRASSKHPGFKYTPEQREIYKTQGGTPFLDMDYTVFGEVVSGLNIVDSIAAVNTNVNDRPVEDVMILSMKMVKK